MNYHFKSVFIAACLGMLLFGIVLISLGTILPFVSEQFSLDPLQAGTLASILPAGILLGSIIFGPIVDRYSYRNLLIACTLIIFIGLEGIAFASSIFILQLSLLLIGIGGGAINGGTNALVADISEKNPAHRSANLTFLGAFFGIGALGVPSLMALLSKYWNYHQIIAGIGVATLMPLIYYLLIAFPAPKHIQYIPVQGYLDMIKDEVLLLFGFFLFFLSAVEGIINNWTTTFLDDRGFPPSEALLLLSVYVLCLTIMRLLLAIILRKKSPLLVLILSLLTLLIGAGLITLSDKHAFVWSSMILMGFGIAAGFPIVLGFVSKIYVKLRGTAFGFVLVLALLGNILINYLTGVVTKIYGIYYFPFMLITCIGFLLILLGFIRKQGVAA